MRYDAQSQPRLTLPHSEPCSFPLSRKTARRSIGSMEVRQGKTYLERMWDPHLLSNRYRVKQPERESGLSSTFLWCQLTICAVTLPFNHTSPSQNAVSTQGQFYTQPINTHLHHCSDTLQLFSILKRAHTLYVALKGNYCFK
jgi:hypothetical protein